MNSDCYKPIPSIAVDENPSWACVVSNDVYGHGVYSWHNHREHAEHNAAVTGGKCVPVSTVNGDVVIPKAATDVIDRTFEQ